jgi:hypothetical protein
VVGLGWGGSTMAMVLRRLEEDVEISSRSAKRA